MQNTWRSENKAMRRKRITWTLVVYSPLLLLLGCMSPFVMAALPDDSKWSLFFIAAYGLVGAAYAFCAHHVQRFLRRRALEPVPSGGYPAELNLYFEDGVGDRDSIAYDYGIVTFEGGVLVFSGAKCTSALHASEFDEASDLFDGFPILIATPKAHKDLSVVISFDAKSEDLQAVVESWRQFTDVAESKYPPLKVQRSAYPGVMIIALSMVVFLLIAGGVLYSFWGRPIVWPAMPFLTGAVAIALYGVWFAYSAYTKRVRRLNQVELTIGQSADPSPSTL